MVFMEHKMSNSKDPGRNMFLPQGASQPDTKFTITIPIHIILTAN